ncbi:uncharacterized protein BXZ73DRAFT_104895 [Epithele typhae]|uniref:uncharacterized protein n=1 Tax=Epithele typhae TaxID=378194 RepID=UPI0020072CCF|nr:uncharacterized protein BXZ73DRAFT_104895 [Epithele typhae]KAH9919788.1 hypothetical protein BXZ73DRAFT_104895 [Epithele typhae]
MAYHIFRTASDGDKFSAPLSQLCSRLRGLAWTISTFLSLVLSSPAPTSYDTDKGQVSVQVGGDEIRKREVGEEARGLIESEGYPIGPPPAMFEQYLHFRLKFLGRD